MDDFLSVFGGLNVAIVAVVISAIVFFAKVLKAITDYLHKKWELQSEKERQMQEVFEQVKQYPKWHNQSIEIRGGIYKAIEGFERKLDDLNDSVNCLRQSGDEGMALTWRYRILRFDDEIRHNDRHTREHFDQIMEDITKYERYCAEHPDFPNNKAVFAVQNIKNVYQRCTTEGTFL